jgi:hypothetical protein
MIKHMCRSRRVRPVLPPGSAFAGFRFPREVIVLAVRWYLHYGLSYRDVEELMAERGLQVDHVTVYRWVQRFTPILAETARCARQAIGSRWQVDETFATRLLPLSQLCPPPCHRRPRQGFQAFVGGLSHAVARKCDLAGLGNSVFGVEGVVAGYGQAPVNVGADAVPE